MTPDFQPLSPSTTPSSHASPPVNADAAELLLELGRSCSEHVDTGASAPINPTIPLLPAYPPLAPRPSSPAPLYPPRISRPDHYHPSDLPLPAMRIPPPRLTPTPLREPIPPPLDSGDILYPRFPLGNQPGTRCPEGTFTLFVHDVREPEWDPEGVMRYYREFSQRRIPPGRILPLPVVGGACECEDTRCRAMQMQWRLDRNVPLEECDVRLAPLNLP